MRVFLSAISLIALCLTTTAHAQTYKTFGKGAKIIKLSDATLTKNQKKGVRTFTTKPAYFGAIYISQDNGGYFWVRNFHGLKMAKTSAAEGCRQISNTKSCKLYAVSIPKSVAAPDDNLMGLGQSAFEAFEQKYRRNQKAEKFGAFAINGFNNWGYTYGFDSISDTKQSALDFCDSSALKGMARYGSDARKWIDASGAKPCHVVHIFTPK